MESSMIDESIKFHQQKKIITKEEFFELNSVSADRMSSDNELRTKALEVLVAADKHRWIHQNTWMGEPVLNLPQDMFALQEIIYKSRPEFIIEVGIAWGGSLLFESTILEIIGGEKVIGVDIFIPKDLRTRLKGHSLLHKRIELIEGSSTSSDVIDRIKQTINNSKKVMVILDSFHTHEHVLNELNVYSQFVGKGQYLICSDTIVEYIPEQKHRTRPWGPGNNPATAVKQFISENTRFYVDKDIDKKLLFSCHPGGYLVAAK
jgi:cephalosporin hydroxylase